MQISFPKNVEHILILGAGSSSEYGLPLWSGLDILIRDKLLKDTSGGYKYKKEILLWLDKVGDGREYETIDKCISVESTSPEYLTNGGDIENEIFLIIKSILKQKYKENKTGWIELLNQKILRSIDTSLGRGIGFINFNYDDVLESNFLDWSNVGQKEQRTLLRERLRNLNEIKALALYPHGYVFDDDEINPQRKIARFRDTAKSGDHEYLDAVSCHDSGVHQIDSYGFPSFNIYILGLSGGLRINLPRIKFLRPISSVHVTIRREEKKEEVVKFLSSLYAKPATEIHVYSSCFDLVNECF